jgi:energy-coupling factor transporter ATP-binding protein EcfA2
MPNSLSRGSEWNRWDLHIHSPASALNNQFPKVANGDPDWEAYIVALEALTEIAVLGITDYFSIEGYKKVCEFKQKGRLKNIGLILPNIEFRIDKIIDASGAKRRLNYHIIFSDRVTPQQIEEHFLHEIKFVWEADPQRTDLSLSVRRENLTLMGERLKKEHASFIGRSDYEIGCTNATVTPTKIKQVLTDKESIFKGQYLIVLPDEHLSLMDWDGQDHLTRKSLLQGADAVFSGNANTIKWTSGLKSATKEEFISEFKSLKPCIHGSDAHTLERIGVPDDKRYCWIKAELTFEGLKQIIYEPEDRVYIGEKPANLKNDYQVIEAVSLEGASDWFGDISVPLNEDLVSIIGPRGSGKSALAEMMAFAGGATIFRSGQGLEDTFLYKAARKSSANPNTIVGTKVSLHWKNKDIDPIFIPMDLKNPNGEEKVKYLPQKFVEWLCAPENNQELEAEIEKVIYQRNKKTERLQASNFQELRLAATQPIEARRQRLIRAIQSLNQSIADGNSKLALKPQKQLELTRKQEELARLIKTPPSLPAENKEELAKLEALEKEKQELESKVVGLNEQLTAVNTIEAKFEVLKDELETFNKEISELLAKAGLSASSESFAITPPDVTNLLTSRRNELVLAAQNLRGEPRVDVPQVVRTLLSVIQEISTIKERSKLTEAKKKEFEKFQQDKQKLEELIASITREITELTNVITPKVKADQGTRIERYLDAFELLREEKQILETLYEPLKHALEKSNETAKKLTFVSRTTFDLTRHAGRGIELFDRRKSAFPDQENLEAALQGFFDTIQQNDFERGATKQALHDLQESFDPSTIKEQMRKDYAPKDFADWFFDFGVFSTTYAIKFDNKELKFLSPGEKGIVLLLLYLEAEEGDNRPLIIDQPDDNLDNLSVYPNLIDYFRARKKTRQIIIITHNPNLVVNTDSDQVIVASFDGTHIPKLEYRSGALEQSNPGGPILGIREEVCRILEGGTKAFQLREARYALPKHGS